MYRTVKSTRIKTPYQIYWDPKLKEEFKALVKDYDPVSPISMALIKLVRQAIADHYLPGYIRREKPKRKAPIAVDNKLSEQVIMSKDNP